MLVRLTMLINTSSLAAGRWAKSSIYGASPPPRALAPARGAPMYIKFCTFGLRAAARDGKHGARRPRRDACARAAIANAQAEVAEKWRKSVANAEERGTAKEATAWRRGMEERDALAVKENEK